MFEQLLILASTFPNFTWDTCLAACARSCLFGCLFILPPFVGIGCAIRSVWSEDPLPVWVLAFVLVSTIASTIYCSILYAKYGFPQLGDPRKGGVVVYWVLASFGMILLGPATLIWEARKRGWTDIIWERLKGGKASRRPKRRHQRGHLPEDTNQRD